MAHPDGGAWYTAWAVANLLVDAGRTEEAVALLEQQEPVDSSILAWHLIDLCRVKDAVVILQRPRPFRTEHLRVDRPTDVPPF
ncbi:hypothetical protein AB0H37_42595 [Actinomadura sp. NPDC023710]|uniref:hypothetical protein n=1 Tax=Actinomadura sp. NPDC023710 TaxID=3158219 RepID=UPI0033CD3DE9